MLEKGSETKPIAVLPRSAISEPGISTQCTPGLGTDAAEELKGTLQVSIISDRARSDATNATGDNGGQPLRTLRQGVEMGQEYQTSFANTPFMVSQMASLTTHNTSIDKPPSSNQQEGSS